MSSAIKPIPADARQQVESTLRKIQSSSDEMAWHVRRMAEAIYATGYNDGHTAGCDEVWADLRTDQHRQAEPVVAAKEAGEAEE